jgi:hypothetical protein
MSVLRVNKIEGSSKNRYEITIPSTNKLIVLGTLRTNIIKSLTGSALWNPDTSGNISTSNQITVSGSVTGSISTTERVELPTWTTSTRPTTNLVNGRIGYNTTSKSVEAYSSGIWRQTTKILDGSSSDRAAASALAILSVNPAATDGVYWIDLPTVGPREIYCIMNSSYNGGGWMMAMKATRGTTFNYGANYWTTTNTLNPTQTNINDGDAKFESFNTFQSKDVMAVWPDLTANSGCFSVSRGHIWLQNNFYNSGQRIALPTFFNSVDRYFLQDANNFCGVGQFSRQTDVRFYGFNYRNNPGNQRTRWGFGWNENGGGVYPNGNMDSDDVFGGIGMNYGSYSAGDGISCCQNVTGFNRSARVEMYVR